MQYQQKLDDIERKFEDLNGQMADPAVISDSAQYRKVSKAHNELAEIVSAQHQRLDRRVIGSAPEPERHPRPVGLRDQHRWRYYGRTGASSTASFLRSDFARTSSR